MLSQLLTNADIPVICKSVDALALDDSVDMLDQDA